MRKLLLSVGTNHTLLGLRNAVFVAAGYGIIPAKSGAVALDAIRSRHLSAVIVGHNLSPAMKERITETAKGRQLPVIVLHAHDYEAPVLGADANLCGIDGAATILRVLAELLGQDSDERIRPKGKPRHPASTFNASSSSESSSEAPATDEMPSHATGSNVADPGQG